MPVPSQKDLFASQTEATASPGELIFELTVPGRLPSWNAILGMEQWARYQFKKELAAGFLCALRQSALDSSMKTTFEKNTLSICAATLESYLKTAQERRRLKSRNKRLALKSKSGLSLKSTKSSKVPF